MPRQQQQPNGRQHLQQHHLGWYVRLRVPKDVKAIFERHPEARPTGIGKNFVITSLNTRDLKTAQQRRWAVITTIKQRFEELRARYLSSPDDDGRRAFELTLERLKGERAEWNEDSFEDLADRLSDAYHDPRSRARRELGEPGTPIFDAHAEFLRPGYVDPTRYAPPVSKIAERYLQDRRRDPDARVTDQTINQEKAVLELFSSFLRSAPGAIDQGLAAVTRKVAVEFLDTIAQLDPLWARSPAKRQATLAQLRARSVEAHEEGLSNRTLNRYTSTMANFLAWAADRYPGVHRDAFSGHWKKPSSTRKTGWLPMTDDEILTILDHTDQLPMDDPMFWVPRIGAHQGMRLNEICSLRVSNVITRDGLTCFNITGAKTEAGDRTLPVHSRVLQAGLLAYIEGLATPGGLLFPTLTPGGPDSKLSWRISPEFTRLRRRLGITRDRVSFHSLRKSMATKLEQARVPESEAVQVLGHEKLSMSYRVYSLGVDLRRLKEIVELVEYRPEVWPTIGGPE